MIDFIRHVSSVLVSIVSITTDYFFLFYTNLFLLGLSSTNMTTSPIPE